MEPPEEMKEMLWMVPSAPWHTISSSAELNGFTICEVNDFPPSHSPVSREIFYFQTKNSNNYFYQAINHQEIILNISDSDPTVRVQHSQWSSVGLSSNHGEEQRRGGLQSAQRDGEDQPVPGHGRAGEERQSLQEPRRHEEEVREGRFRLYAADLHPSC